MTLVNARRSLNLQFPLDSFPKFGKMTVAQWPTFAQRSCGAKYPGFCADSKGV